mgnify:FL=1
MRRQKIHWERIFLLTLISAPFTGFLLWSIWQLQNEEAWLANQELKVKDPLRNAVMKVTAPLFNAKIKSPVTLAGQANVFEAQMNARVKDASGLILAETSFQTREGQTMSPFLTKVTYKKPSRPKGTIEIFSFSPKDGAEINKIIIPVLFQD